MKNSNDFMENLKNNYPVWKREQDKKMYTSEQERQNKWNEPDLQYEDLRSQQESPGDLPPSEVDKRNKYNEIRKKLLMLNPASS